MTTYSSGATGRLPARRLIKKVILLVWVGLVLCAAIQAQTANEYEVKAAFILNFVRFVEWPDDAFGDGGSLVVGIVGDDPFRGALDQLSGNTVDGRRLVVRQLRSTDNLRACQILFVSSSERNRLGKIMESVRGASVLTIGEVPQFNQVGGVIRFIVQDNKVRFEINTTAAVQARLRISSKLQALSKGGRN